MHVDFQLYRARRRSERIKAQRIKKGKQRSGVGVGARCCRPLLLVLVCLILSFFCGASVRLRRVPGRAPRLLPPALPRRRGCRRGLPLSLASLSLVVDICYALPSASSLYTLKSPSPSARLPFLGVVLCLSLSFSLCQNSKVDVITLLFSPRGGGLLNIEKPLANPLSFLYILHYTILFTMARPSARPHACAAASCRSVQWLMLLLLLPSETPAELASSTAKGPAAPVFFTPSVGGRSSSHEPPPPPSPVAAAAAFVSSVSSQIQRAKAGQNKNKKDPAIAHARTNAKSERPRHRSSS